MLTLLQLLKILDNEAKQGLLSWCDLIHQDPNEIDELADQLDVEFGIELSEIQLERLLKVCQNKTYLSAFELDKLK